jgi:hypothetical protein
MTISANTKIMRRAIWTGEDSLVAAALRIADGLRLAAAPSYAVMALATAIFGETPKDMLCMALDHTSALGGMVGSMVWMYTLMTVFHSASWLKLIAHWAGAARS